VQLPPDLNAILDAVERVLPFAGISTFMKQRYSREVEAGEIAVMGVPFDSGATWRPGARYGPRAIREHSIEAAEYDPIYPWERSLSDVCRIVDFGDVAVMPGTRAVESMLEATETVATAIYEAGASLLTLGGEHTIPYGLTDEAA
jgi:agmatinase